MNELETTINVAWEQRDEVGFNTEGPVRDAVAQALDALDSGRVRVAEKVGGEWVVKQWLKKSVLLSFLLNDMQPVSGGPGGAPWWDKVPSKFAGWDAARFRAAGFRAVPSRDRPLLRLHRALGGADAELREPRRLRGQRHHDRHLGHRRLLRADRQELPRLRRRRDRRRAGNPCRRNR